MKPSVVQQRAQGRGGGGFGARPPFAVTQPAAPLGADAVARAIETAKAAAARVTGGASVAHTGATPALGASPAQVAAVRKSHGHLVHVSAAAQLAGRAVRTQFASLTQSCMHPGLRAVLTARVHAPRPRCTRLCQTQAVDVDLLVAPRRPAASLITDGHRWPSISKAAQAGDPTRQA